MIERVEAALRYAACGFHTRQQRSRIVADGGVALGVRRSSLLIHSELPPPSFASSVASSGMVPILSRIVALRSRRDVRMVNRPILIEGSRHES